MTTVETIYQPEYEGKKEVSGIEASKYLYSEDFVSGFEPSDVNRIRNFFDDFGDVGTVVVEQGDKRYRIKTRITPDLPEDTTLVIKNPKMFIELVLEFENEKEKVIPRTGGKLRNTWAAYTKTAQL